MNELDPDDEDQDQESSHEELPIDNPRVEKSQKRRKPKCKVMMNHASINYSILPIVTATALKPDGTLRELRLLLDTASTASFVKVGPSSLHNFEIIEPSLSLNISHLGGSSNDKATDLVCVRLKAPGNRTFTVPAYTTKSILKLPAPNIDPDKLSLLDKKFGKDLSVMTTACDVDVLLGAGDTMQLIEKVIKFNDLFVLKTPWGYTPCGNLATNQVSCLATNFEELNRTLEKLWRVDEMNCDNRSGLTRDEIAAVEKIEENLKFNPARGRFETALLFKNPPNLLNNYDRALARFAALQRTLNRNDELKDVYCKAIHDFLDAGVVELVHDDQAENKDRRDIYYLPHRAVYDPTRISTQCRVVFDASAKTATGNSLNTFLLPGPALQQDIAALAMRFRLRKIVLIGDISKMFLNIDVREQDRDYLRFLWKEPGETGKPRVYRFSALIFGATDSPFQAMTCLQKLVAEKLEDPSISDLERRACDVILRDTYVDDITTGGETVAETVNLMKSIQSLLNRAHFFVKKWKTNSPEVLQQIPEAERAPVKLTELDGLMVDEQDGSSVISDSSKMLGLSWDPEADVIYFNHEAILPTNDDTKTAVASLFAKIYDPLGLASPFVLQARQVLKKTHQLKLGWKQKLPEDLLPEWHQWLDQVKDLNTLRFGRYIHVDQNSEVHIFSDASVTGYGAAAYVRNHTNNGYTSQLLIARSRIAPIKEHTVPRLELMAALVASTMAQEIYSELKVPKEKISCWSDSEIVLFWLQKNPDALIPFVGNRVEKIQQFGFPFFYVNTLENPADIASRGCNAADLNATLWIKGPNYLELPRKHWPLQKFDLSKAEERQGLRKKNVFNYSNLTLLVKGRDKATLIPLEQYCSSYSKLIQKTASLFRIADIWLSKVRRDQVTWTKGEYERRAILFWNLQAQRDQFSNEIAALKNKKNVASSSSLAALTPFLDENGLIRVGGRLAYANISEEAKHPVILPKDHKVTALLIRHAHNNNMHMGTDWVHHYLRQNYWILSSRQVIKNLLRRCVPCLKLQGKKGEQQMAQLPVPRVQKKVPFSHVGVDYTGSLHLREARKNDVGYVVVFTCLTTRAVHLEVVKTGKTEDFVNALKRMISSKGSPTDIYSDNALVFQATKGKLEDPGSQLRALLPTTKWHFSTEAAPHTGGVWERVVGLVKRPLSKAVGRQKLDYVDMLTICKEVEGILNDRPLAAVSADSMEAITPSMLTLGRKIKSCPPTEQLFPNSTPHPVRQQLGEREQLVEKFWRAWLDEYCLSLQKMNKWNKQQPNISVGELVLVEKRPLNRSHWPLARVDSVTQSRDGLIRKIRVKLPPNEAGEQRYLTRSIHNIYPLELHDANETDANEADANDAEAFEVNENEASEN